MMYGVIEDVKWRSLLECVSMLLFLFQTLSSIWPVESVGE